MALGTAYKVCGVGVGAGSATLQVTVTTTTTAGDSVSVWVTENSGAVSSVTDSQGNSYTLDGAAVLNGALHGAWYTALNTTKLTSGTDWVKLTLSASGGSKTLSAVGCSGVATSSAVDQAPTPTTGSTSPASITSGTLAQASELCLSGLVQTNGAGTVTWGNGFSQMDSQQAGTAEIGACAATDVSATTAVTSSATFTSENWGQVLITLKAAGGASHTATAALTVTPSFSAARTRAKFRTAALTVTPTFAAARKQGHARHAALTVTPAFSAARKQGHARHAALTVTPSFSAVPSLGLPAAAAFPGSPLGLAVDANLGGWTAITGYVKQPLTITRGRPDESPACNPGSAPMMWNNGDGRFSPRLATGPYYGLLGRNTPVRVSIPASGTYLRMEDDQASYCSTPDTSALDITGTIDVRIDCAPTSYVPSVLASKWASGERSWALTLNGDGTLTFWWTTDGATIGSLQSTASVPPGETCMRVKLTASTGTAVFYTAAAGQINGTFTQLGASVSTGGSTSIFNGTAAVAVGACAAFTADESSYSGLTGAVFEFELINSSGSTVAHPIFDAQSAGTTSFTDSHSLTWTVSGTAEISGRSYRFHGEAASLPVQWDVTGHDIWAPAACAGPLRRMGQGNAPLPSAVKRAILSQGAAAYWPAEDLAGSASVASAIGGPAMTVLGAPGFAGDSAFLCSNPVATVESSTWTGQVPAYAGTGTTVLRFLLDLTTPPVDGTVFIQAGTTGTIRSLQLNCTAGGSQLILNGFTVTGVSGPGAFLLPGPAGLAAGQYWVSIELTESGTTLDVALSVLEAGAATPATTTTTVTSASAGNVTSVTVNLSQTADAGAGLGHIAVQPALYPLAGLAQVLNAWQGETAGNRFARLAGENGYQARIIGPPDVSVAMGPQSPDTLTDLLNECQTADMGMIFEPRQALALGYITQAALLNQAAAVTLDASLGQLDGMGWPTDDDQYSRNDWTVTRGSGAVSGSSFQAQLDDGSAMSISPPPDGIGDYSDTVTSNVETDSMLPDQAWWRVHLGTVDEARYPLVTADLANTALGATLTGEIAAADIGAFLAIANPPAWLPPDLIRQLAAGTVEQLGDFVWKISWNAIPESPYETGIYDDAVHGRADTDGSELETGISSSASSMSVATETAGSPLWTTAAADFPLSVIMGGEVMTISAISGTSSPQTFTISARSVNGVVRAQTAGQDVRLYPTPVYAML